MARKHAHHWEIERANGPTSKGTFKLCGAVKTLKNSFEAAGTVRATWRKPKRGRSR